MKNALLNDIWEIRDKIGAECGHDLKCIGALVRNEETKIGKRLVHPIKPAVRSKHRIVAVDRVASAKIKTPHVKNDRLLK